jgi:hypothetical protein
MNHFYVYAYFREDGSPYYIGKGQRVRAYQPHRRRGISFTPKDRSRIRFFHEGLSNDDAQMWEVFWIAKFGRKDEGGILINLTDGGEGAGRPHSVESKKKMSDYWSGRKRKPMSEETKEKIRQTNKGYGKGRTIPQETRDKIRNTLRNKS